MSRLPPIFERYHFPHHHNNYNLLKKTLSFSSFPKIPSSSSSSSYRRVRMSLNSAAAGQQQKKVVVIMGPTGCGKSKLSVDLATRFFPSSEIINSDKIQVYKGLDITTNKIPFSDRKNVPHHLLGEFDGSSDFTPSDFRSSASSVISQIISRGVVPFIVGGSNSFIYALLADKFDPDNNFDVFSDDVAFCKELRYRCCFIWVDVSKPVLNRYLVKRVDDMLESGMYEELCEYFSDPGSVVSGSGSGSAGGLKKAIGVPEFERYFVNGGEYEYEYEEAVREIKDNTCELARRQVGKILRLRDAAGWDLKRVDATAAVVAALGGRRVAAEMLWERQVLEPSVKIVKRFLMD